MTEIAKAGPRVPMSKLAQSRETVVKPKIETNELSKNAMGGTELMITGLMSRLPRELTDHFQIIPSRVRDIDPKRKPIWWLHDLPGDPESNRFGDADFRSRFAAIVFVSHFQRHWYLTHYGVPAEPNQVVIRNAITPFSAAESTKSRKIGDPIRLIYHTTPHRGLALLLPVVEALWNVRQDFVVDVYSSFALYGWKERDAPYEDLFDRCRNHPAIRYHGSVPNDVVRKALSESDIFAYPSIWPETSCICAIEALSARNIVVTSSLGALPETTGNYAQMYDYVSDPIEHANRFLMVLNAVMDAVAHKPDYFKQHLDSQKYWADNIYDWDVASQVWIGLLKSRLEDG